MSDERNSEQQAGGLTEQAVGTQHLASEELLLNNPETASSSGVTTSGDSSEEVTTPEVSTGEVTTPEIPPSVEVALEEPSNLEVISEGPANLEVTLEVPSNEAVEPEVPSVEVAAGEVPLVSTVDQSEPTDKTLPVEIPCDPCDPTDPYGLKSDPGCDLPLCIPPPEEPQEDPEPLADELQLPTGEQSPLSKEEGDTLGEHSEVQEGEVSEETKDLADPCADPEEPACDFPKPAVEKSVGRLTNEELEGLGDDIGDDMKEGSFVEGSPAVSQENPVPDSAVGEPLGLEHELEVEVEVEAIAVDPCGPRDPCGFPVDIACVGPEDESLPSESPGELQSDVDGASPQTDRQQD